MDAILDEAEKMIEDMEYDTIPEVLKILSQLAERYSKMSEEQYDRMSNLLGTYLNKVNTIHA